MPHNFYFYEKRPRETTAARNLFRLIKAGRCEAYTSEYVVEELKKASKQKYQPPRGKPGSLLSRFRTLFFLTASP
jgi:hypothetical protein